MTDRVEEAPATRGRMMGALAILFVGIAFWVRSPVPLGFHAERWWALIMLLPAVMFLIPRDGPVSRGKKAAAGAIAGVAAVFLLTPGFGVGWPLLLVVVGAVALIP